MKLINGRLIINENEIDEACEKLRGIVQSKLDTLGHGNVIVDVVFDNECWNEKTCAMWCEIDINLLTSSGFLGCISFTTESYEPTLVYTNQFEFYYVFEQSSNTCTNPTDMLNTGHSKLKCVKCLEQILLDDLYERL